VRGNSFVFHGAPTHPLSGKGSNMAFFGLTTFLLAARPCRVVSKKNKKMNPTKETLKRFTKKHRHRHRTHNDTDLWDGGSCCVRRIRANRLACRLGFVVHRVLQLATPKTIFSAFSLRFSSVRISLYRVSGVWVSRWAQNTIYHFRCLEQIPCARELRQSVHVLRRRSLSKVSRAH